MNVAAKVLPFSRSEGTSAVLCGLGTWVPPRVVSNAEIASRLDTSDEWIRARTGIRERHVIEPGMSTSDLAVEAGQRALKSADLGRVVTRPSDDKSGAPACRKSPSRSNDHG